jgi:hypothetical protein
VVRPLSCRRSSSNTADQSDLSKSVHHDAVSAVGKAGRGSYALNMFHLGRTDRPADTVGGARRSPGMLQTDLDHIPFAGSDADVQPSVSRALYSSDHNSKCIKLHTEPTYRNAEGKVVGKLYTNPIDCLWKTLKTEGFFGWYKGELRLFPS